MLVSLFFYYENNTFCVVLCLQEDEWKTTWRICHELQQIFTPLYNNIFSTWMDTSLYCFESFERKDYYSEHLGQNYDDEKVAIYVHVGD